MQPQTPTRKQTGKILKFACLSLALILGICAVSSSRHRRSKPFTSFVSISTLDAKAKPFFDQARSKVPDAVATLTSSKGILKLASLMVKDKLKGSIHTQDYLNSVLRPVIRSCQQGAAVYGCRLDTSGLAPNAALSGRNQAKSIAYAIGGLTLDTLFIRSTIGSLNRVIGAAIARISTSLGSGAACAAADGPLPIGDLIGLVLAAGGTATSVKTLLSARSELARELCQLLNNSIQECQAVSRKAALQ